MAQIHRFHDVAAIWDGTPKGSTRYMTANEARRVAAALLAVARSIEREPFTASAGLTVSFETQGDTWRFPRLDRREDGALVPKARQPKAQAPAVEGAPDRVTFTAEHVDSVDRDWLKRETDLDAPLPGKPWLVVRTHGARRKVWGWHTTKAAATAAARRWKAKEAR